MELSASSVSIERKKRDNSNVSAEIERVVPKKWNSSKIHCSIFLHALLPKCRETCEDRSGLVGPESHGRGRLSEIIYWVYYRIL